MIGSSFIFFFAPAPAAGFCGGFGAEVEVEGVEAGAWAWGVGVDLGLGIDVGVGIAAGVQGGGVVLESEIDRSENLRRLVVSGLAREQGLLFREVFFFGAILPNFVGPRGNPGPGVGENLFVTAG